MSLSCKEWAVYGLGGALIVLEFMLNITQTLLAKIELESVELITYPRLSVTIYRALMC